MMAAVPAVLTLCSDIEWTPDITSRSCTVARVHSIAFTPMSGRLRNELITRTYRDLASGMAGLCGPDATWTTFGQWASHTIGSFMTLPIPLLGTIIARSFGYGNREVFADIGAAQALFLETVGQAVRRHGGPATATVNPDPINQAFEQFQARLSRAIFVPPGNQISDAKSFWETIDDDTRSVPDEPGNQRLIIGFGAYKDAILSDDPAERSKNLLVGNCLLALHEQRVLALEISMGFRSWIRNVTRFWYLVGTQRAWLNEPPGRWRLWLENWWIRFATRHFVRVDLPCGSVKVGRPVPPGEHPIIVGSAGPDPGTLHDEDVLLDELAADRFLHELVTEFDVDGRPARCWNDLHDRMSYIIALFAQHQRSPDWWDGPPENGNLKECPPWWDFEDKLTAQIGRMTKDTPKPLAVGKQMATIRGVDAIDGPNNALTGDRTVTSLAAGPLTRHYLDRLRQRPSYPVLAPTGSGDEAPDLRAFAQGALNPAGQHVMDDVRQRCDALRRPGGLLDDVTVEAARRVFADNRTLVYLALFLRSLPDAYAAAQGVEVLGRMSELASDPMRRASETAHFVADLLDRAQGTDNAPFDLTPVAGVRYMHSVAARYLEDEGWDSDTYGVPVNQEDILATALSFSVPIFELFDNLDLRIDDADRDGYVRFWLGVGHLLGAPVTAINNYRDALAAAVHIRARHHARSLSGVRLTEGLLEGIGAGFPRGTSWMARGLMHALGDPDVVHLLMVTEGRGRMRSEVMASILRLGLSNRVTRVPMRALVNAVGARALRPYYELGRSSPFRRQPLPGEPISRAPVIDPACWPTGCRRPESPAPQASPEPAGLSPVR